MKKYYIYLGSMVMVLLAAGVTFSQNNSSKQGKAQVAAKESAAKGDSTSPSQVRDGKKSTEGTPDFAAVIAITHSAEEANGQKLTPDKNFTFNLAIDQPLELTYVDCISKASDQNQVKGKTGFLYGDLATDKDGKSQKFYSFTSNVADANNRKILNYRFKSKATFDFCIFDPVQVPGKNSVLFKCGDAQYDSDSYGIYLFDLQSKKVRLLDNRFISNSNLSVSPDGQYVFYIVGGGKNGPDKSISAKPLELWVTNLETGSRKRVAIGDRINGTPAWFSQHKLSYSIGVQDSVSAIFRYDAYIYDAVDQKSTSLLKDCLSPRVSYTGSSVLFAGRRDIHAPHSFENNALYSGEIGLSKRQLLDNKEFLPISYTYWLQNPTNLVCVKSVIPADAPLGKDKIDDKNIECKFSIYLIDIVKQKTQFLTDYVLDSYDSQAQFNFLGWKSDGFMLAFKSREKPKNSLASTESNRYDVVTFDVTGKELDDQILRNVGGLSVVNPEGNLVRVAHY